MLEILLTWICWNRSKLLDSTLYAGPGSLGALRTIGLFFCTSALFGMCRIVKVFWTTCQNRLNEALLCHVHFGVSFTQKFNKANMGMRERDWPGQAGRTRQCGKVLLGVRWGSEVFIPPLLILPNAGLP